MIAFTASFDLKIFLSLMLACIITFTMIPSIVHIARAKHLVDVPNGRTSHTSLTPNLGGIAIFAGYYDLLPHFS